MSSVMRWRSGLAFACEEVMIGLLLENEADCLIRQHTEPRGGSPMNRTRWPEPPTARAVSFFGHQQPFAVAQRWSFKRLLQPISGPSNVAILAVICGH
jgi:hypothetical protein